MDSEFRPLNPRERALLEKLLEAHVPGEEEFRTQLASVTAKQLHEDGTLVLRCASGPPSPAYGQGLVAEGWCKDADGLTICVMLHVNREGFMRMLEIFKADGSEITNPPSAPEMMLLLPEDGGRKPDEK